MHRLVPLTRSPDAVHRADVEPMAHQVMDPSRFDIQASLDIPPWFALSLSPSLPPSLPPCVSPIRLSVPPPPFPSAEEDQATLATATEELFNGVQVSKCACEQVRASVLLCR